MKKLLLVAVGFAWLAPSMAQADVSIRFTLPLPEAPPLVYIEPDVQVVEDYDQEVFFHGGFYWTRRDGHWFRSLHPHHEFVYVEPRFIPAPLMRIELGRYRRYRHGMSIHERERLRREEFRREELRREEWRRHHDAEWREQERHRAQERERWDRERREDERRRQEREHQREAAVRHEPPQQHHKAVPAQSHPQQLKKDDKRHDKDNKRGRGRHER
jgi:hypothetical protein